MMIDLPPAQRIAPLERPVIVQPPLQLAAMSRVLELEPDDWTLCERLDRRWLELYRR